MCMCGVRVTELPAPNEEENYDGYDDDADDNDDGFVVLEGNVWGVRSKKKSRKKIGIELCSISFLFSFRDDALNQMKHQHTHDQGFTTDAM